MMPGSACSSLAGNFESDEFALPAGGAAITLTCAVPAFYPDEGAQSWSATPQSRQARAKHHYFIKVDGGVRLDGSVDYSQAGGSTLLFGSNPLGGSLVSRQFAGKILESSDRK